MIILPTPGTAAADTLNTFRFNFVYVCVGFFFLIKHQNLAQSKQCLTVHRP